MTIADLMRRLESTAEIAAIGGRTLLGLDTNPVPDSWSHITKIDPEGEKKIPLSFPLYLSHTSAVSVGGSKDVTDANTEETFEILNAANVPALHEPSAATHVTDETRERADFLAIPEVLNGDSEALVGTLGRGLEYVREELAPQQIEDKIGFRLDEDGILGKRISNFAAGFLMHQAVFEAYIIMNPDSAAAREATVTEDDLLSPQTARERALAAEYHLESEIIYLEYSGTFGGDEAVAILEEIDDAVTWSRLWYGGGLDSRENVERVLQAGADAVIVGDVFHDIAEVEATLFEEALGEFDTPPDVEELEAWIEGQLDVELSSPARYLSTIQSVDNPASLATQYLATGIRMALILEELRYELDEPTPSTLESAIADRNLLADTVSTIDYSGSETLMGQIGRSLLAEEFELASMETLPVRHFEINLTETRS